MSWTVRIIRPKGPECKHCGKGDEEKELGSVNITYNVGPALIVALQLCFERGDKLTPLGSAWEWLQNANLTAGRLRSILLGMASNIQRNEALFRPHWPANGWGTAETTCAALDELAIICDQMDANVRPRIEF